MSSQPSQQIERHPLPPFLPSDAKLLMLGSFPPPKTRWNMDFYYPNFQNDMWRIFGQVFFADKDHFVDLIQKKFKQAQIADFLTQKGIAIFDSATQVIRLKGNASDKFLQIVEWVDIAALLAQIPACCYILTTGDKATESLMSVLPASAIKPSIGKKGRVNLQGRQIELYRLPSSSRAYPMSLQHKALAYHHFFQEIGMLEIEKSF